MSNKRHEIVGKSADHSLQAELTKALRTTADSLDNLDNRVSNLEDTMRINGTQEFEIHKLGTKAVIKALGGKETKAYKQMSKKVCAMMWREYKECFNVPRYGELPAKQFKDGLRFVTDWEPKQEVKMAIQDINESK